MEINPVAAEECQSIGLPDVTLESYESKEVSLGELHVTRVLPIRNKRMVGPWCFFDRFGPLSFTDAKPMDVAPHPHTGLQTVTWLIDGEVLHDDSIGSEATARPGGVNIMTAGKGIAHAEQTPRGNSGKLNGVQLWVALPDFARNMEPMFEGLKEVPKIEERGGIIHVFAGGIGGVVSPGKYFSEIVGAELQIHPGQSLEFPLNPHFEHAVMILDGDCSMGNEALADHRLYYLGAKRSSMSLKSRSGGRIMLIGGPAFPEKILMWWNFVARTPEEIAQAREDWESHIRFGDVTAYEGPRLKSPDIVRFAIPNPMS